ncbi:hypothetical protein KAJ87_04185 [Candidatus Pacearchaeota archaeon]|nr:hypothetical protein [Candidatus Pacearchaeota archaeon]
MIKDKFSQRKRDVLSKLDKSSKKSWDKKITKLCEKINSLENYYTTSSCSGRVVVMLDQDKKGPELFKFVSHDLICFNDLLRSFPKEKAKLNLKFKMEPCILHVACKNLESAKKLYDKAKLAGWKRSGLISFDKNIILELNSTEKLEFPIMRNGNFLVDEDFLRIIVLESNKKLEKSWGKIKKLRELLESFKN